MSYNNSASFDRVSEEANGDVLLFPDTTDPFSDLGFEFLFDESSLSDIPVAGVCDFPNFTGRLNLDFIKNEILLIFFCLYRITTRLC